MAPVPAATPGRKAEPRETPDPPHPGGVTGQTGSYGLRVLGYSRADLGRGELAYLE